MGTNAEQTAQDDRFVQHIILDFAGINRNYTNFESARDSANEEEEEEEEEQVQSQYTDS